MKALSNLGVILLLIGAGYLIYLGVAGTGQSNTGLIIGLALVVVGYILHIFLDKKTNSLPENSK